MFHYNSHKIGSKRLFCDPNIKINNLNGDIYVHIYVTLFALGYSPNIILQNILNKEGNLIFSLTLFYPPYKVYVIIRGGVE